MKTLTLHAIAENLEPFMQFFRDFISNCEFTDAENMQTELAIEEIVVNVINYAYPQDKTRDLQIQCSRSNNARLIVTIIDSGKAYDPLSKTDPDIKCNLEERSIGGLGIYLAKQFMDNISYQRIDNQNVLTLTKN